jgi:Superfamily I DNA and RNA helicases
MTKSQQDKAIEKIKGPCIIKAGAGTGKTYTIVHKIAYLLEKKACEPSEILCLTFSNAGTNNLRKQVQEISNKAAEMTIRTFHGFCGDVLKEFGHLIKIGPNFEILLPEDAKIMFYRDLDISPYSADLYVKSISTAKDLGVSLSQIEDHVKKLKELLGDVKDPDKKAEDLELELNTLHLKPQETKEQRKEIKERKKEINNFLEKYYQYTKYSEFAEAWKKYNDLKVKKNVLDFADLNFNVLQLIHKFGPKRIAEKYKYVIIDEFQDTNKLQFELIDSLARDHKDITVVGDPNQTIYGFRGAYRESFNHFMEVFEVDLKTDIFKLDKSFRSPNTVLRVAHKLITNNYEDPKECFLVENAKEIEGKKVEVFELKKGEEEARKVAEIVDEEITKGTPLNEICILFRTHAQGELLRKVLEAKNIPLISAGNTDMMMTPEIKTAVAYLSIINNLAERTGTGEQSWWSLFHYHNMLSPEDTVRIGRYLRKNRDEEISIDEALLNNLDKIELSDSGKKIVHNVISKLRELVKSSNKPLPNIVLDIYEITGLNRAFTHTRSIRNVEALMNLKKLYEIAENYYKNHSKELKSFIEYIEILDELGVDIETSKIEDVNAVRIMTIHAVKGLEFNTVIVTNLAEKRFPIERTHKEPLIPKELNPDIKRHLDSLGKLSEEEKLEAIKEYEWKTMLCEERRLCYVAFTRAKKRLVLTFARSYNDEPDSAMPSLFLNEIDFKENKDVSLIKDDEEKCTVFAPSSKFEEYKSLLKKQLVESLDSEDFPSLLSRLVAYHSTREGKIEDYAKETDWKKIVDKKELERHIKMFTEKHHH